MMSETAPTCASIVRCMWEALDERTRHSWRRTRFLGEAKDVSAGSVTAYLPRLRVPDIPAVAAVLGRAAPVAQADILPVILAAAVSPAEAMQLVERLVGVAVEIVPCDPDPTWCNDRDWSSVPLWVSQGEVLVRADGFWDPMPRRRWSIVGPTGSSAAPMLSRRAVAEAIRLAVDAVGREPAQDEIHPAFRRWVARKSATCRPTTTSVSA